MTDLKKSSDEIITELFDSINTINSKESESEEDSSKKDRKTRKKMKKSKKSKKMKSEKESKTKRHKKRKKKRKKHKRKSSSENPESETNDEDEKKLKRKGSKHKTKNDKKEGSVTIKEDQLTNFSHLRTDKNANVPEKNELSAIDNNSETSLIPLPPTDKTNIIETLKSSELCDSNSKSEDLSVNSLKVADVFVEDLIECGDQKSVKSLINPAEKPKMAIKISDLRNSCVLELAEEQAKLKADLQEEGEIVDTSGDSTSDILPVTNDDLANGTLLGDYTIKLEIIGENLNRENKSSSQAISSCPSKETQISVDTDVNKEKRSKVKHRKKSKDREKSKDHSPKNNKSKRHSSEKYQKDDCKEKKKSERERSREKKRSRERKTGVRSKSRDRRSRSRSRVRYRSRSKERYRSKSKERKRSRDRLISKDSDKSRDKKKSSKERKLQEANFGEEIINKNEQKQHAENVLKDESSSEKNKASHTRSKDRKRERSRSKDSIKRKREKRSSERRGRSRDRHSRRSRSSRSPSRSKHKSEYFIDKSKLLEIARKNALNMIKQGQVNIGVSSGLAGGIGVGATADVNKVAAITAGGKTVDELTDFCKLLSQKEATGQESVSSESSSDNENERPFHHPFQLKERPNNIIMNIRNCASLPVKTHQEKTTENAQQLRLQFPVSSGQQHRKTESEWIPVSSTKNEPKAILAPPAAPQTFEPPPMPIEAERIIQQPFMTLQHPPPPPPVFLEPSVHHTNNYEISNMINDRLTEMRHQYETSNQPYHQVNCWPTMENQAGLFTGSTGARVLSAAELSSGQQAWAKQDQLICAQPVCGGMGMSLLQKMGWKPGEGLGKRREGSLEPLKLKVKMDKRGLVCAEELPRRQKVFPPPPTKDVPLTAKSLEGKHPVSLLVEYCSRRHFPPPIFTVISEEGPAHKKNFVFKVTVNGIDFQPPTPSPNKKQAKSEAATLCLKSLNILPTV